MRVKRIGWAGTRTSEYPAMVAFLQGVLGLTTSQEGFDFAAFQLPEGGTFEVFGPADQDHEHFSTGPVVGFVVDDLTGAVRELDAAGVELLGGQVDERGGGWRHFRAPDGNVYELTSGQSGGLVTGSEIDARARLVRHEPSAYLERISPTPLLMTVAAGDHLTPTDLALEACQRAREPKKLVLLPGGHFDAYVKDFDTASGAARDWFLEHLSTAGRAPYVAALARGRCHSEEAGQDGVGT